MGVLEEYLKDIEDVSNMKKDLSNLKNQLIETVINTNGKKRRDNSHQDRTISEKEMGEIL